MYLPRIGKTAPNFSGKAVLDQKVFNLSSSDYEGKYLILLFFPMDFGFVCPTELITFSEHLDLFAKINTTIVACSVESHLTHLRWLNMSHKDGGVRDLRIPLIADKNMEITKKFGVLNEDEGTAYRAMFIIDDKGILRQITINDSLIGRSVIEACRLIRTIQHAEKLRECASETDFIEVCPAVVQKTRSFLCAEKSIPRELVE